MSFLNLRFENDVKMYGTQANAPRTTVRSPFENDVKMYGTQACFRNKSSLLLFENDVKMYGTQARCFSKYLIYRLRMM